MLRGRSLDEARVRTEQYVRARLERIQLALGRTNDVHTHGRHLDDAFLDGLSGEHPSWVARQIVTLDPTVLDDFRGQYERLLDGQMALLGLNPLHAGNPPDWHRDASSGIIAPRLHWSRVPYLDPQVVGDHKVLWEVNRHQYLYAPAFLWLIDGNPDAFSFVQMHLHSWLEENPRWIGVNWASSLEVAYRAITWCWLLWWLRDAPWDQLLRQRLLARLEAHALHVERYLSTYFSPNTHLTGEALGLFYVGSVLRTSRHSARWRAHGAKILESMLARQIHEDGVYFEQASLYQRYTIEIYLHYLLLANATGWTASPAVTERLSDMLDVMRAMADGAGRIPLLGDDDGGRLLPIDACSPDEITDLLLAGAVTLDRPHLVPVGRQHPSLSCWLLGSQRTQSALTAAQCDPHWRSMYFAAGGTAVMRENWSERGHVAVMDAGPHGAMNCGHAHADALSCTLSFGRKALFIDRGTYTYVGGRRNEFRVTQSHNTMEFDDTSTIEPTTAFQWRDVPPRPSAELMETARATLLIAHAQGHHGSGRPSAHWRTMAHVESGAWVIFDRGQRQNCGNALVRWQLHPDLQTADCDGRRVEVMDADGIPLATIVALIGSGLRVEDRDVSLRFGDRRPAKMVVIQTNAALCALTLVIPAPRDASRIVIDELPARGHTAWAWRDDCGTHHLVARCSGCEPVLAYDIRTGADVAWFSGMGVANSDSPADPDHAILLGTHAFQVEEAADPATTILATAERGIALSRIGGSWAKVPGSLPRRGQE
jgi:hypothetical protein